jgi:hypothetical protein
MELIRNVLAAWGVLAGLMFLALFTHDAVRSGDFEASAVGHLYWYIILATSATVCITLARQLEERPNLRKALFQWSVTPLVLLILLVAWDMVRHGWDYITRVKQHVALYRVLAVLIMFLLGTAAALKPSKEDKASTPKEKNK